MPIINKIYKRIEEKGRKKKYQNKNENLNHKAVYNTQAWRNLRLFFLSHNPLCKRCLKEDKIESAVEVHHIIPISTGKSIIEKKTLGFDINNLEGLCEKHHKEEHKKMKNDHNW